ncbi:hypothetical protein [Marinilabilia sp.]|uniref:hypothetical protein n=1 Tax=Marinilabilia sp. TaxID=2021252 RepID=UPI0025BA8065|nr:hypothetical protein [Marinilabilia sp.]
MNDDTNGLVHQFGSDEIAVRAKFIPPQLRVIQDIERDFDLLHFKDSLLNNYSNSIYFMVTLKPTPNCRVRDLRYFNVTDEKEFDARQRDLHYDMAQCFILKTVVREYAPKLCHLEQDFASGGGLKFILVFVPEKEINQGMDLAAGDLELHFSDPFFEIPSVQFAFKKQDLKAIPKLKK